MADSAEVELWVFCSVQCGVEWMGVQVVQKPDIVIALLSLLVAFFGRKKIWAVLRVPRKQVAKAAGGRTRQDAGTEDEELKSEK